MNTIKTKFHSTGEDTSQYVHAVKTQGFCLIKNWFTQEQVKEITEELESLYKRVPQGGSAVVEHAFQVTHGDFAQGKDLILRPPAYSYIKNIQKYIMNSQPLNDVLDEHYGKGCQRFLQTFSTMENTVVDKKDLARHSWMHVDPFASLKFAFFPYGSTAKTGALRVIPNSRQEGATIRQHFMKTENPLSKNPQGLRGGIAHRLIDFQKECPDLVTRREEEAVFIEASPCDLVIVDTDVYHTGGEMKEQNKTRMAVYIHNRP